MKNSNPRNPKTSPLRVETVGGWTGEYTNYTNPNPPKPQVTPVGRRHPGVVEFPDMNAYQKSKTPEVLEDKRLEQAIKQDLQRRNIK